MKFIILYPLSGGWATGCRVVGGESLLPGPLSEPVAAWWRVCDVTLLWSICPSNLIRLIDTIPRKSLKSLAYHELADHQITGFYAPTKQTHIQGTHCTGKNRENGQKDSLSGKTQGILKCCQNTGETTGILVRSSCKFLDSKGKRYFKIYRENLKKRRKKRSLISLPSLFCVLNSH